MSIKSALLGDFIYQVQTPAFVIDERCLIQQLAAISSLRDRYDFKLLYALKPLPLKFVLEIMLDYVDGFAASSLFEAQLAHSVLAKKGTVHLTTPGIQPFELDELRRLCNLVAFNSLPQFRRFAPRLNAPDQVGLRINPQLSVVNDLRYDPCRLHSKLGVTLDRLAKKWKQHPRRFDRLSGLLFHTNCDSMSFEPLCHTVRRLERKLGAILSHISWINLGGGYLFGLGSQSEVLGELVYRLQSRYGLVVYIEPGAALVRNAGYLITTVVDLFRQGGKSIAVLDTTVNHMPEVFEYQFKPDILGADDNADHEYQLVGSSCLAGDVFGTYGFRQRLRVGSRVVLTNFGAYTMVKAHMFNGINLPSIYSVTPSGTLILKRRFTYDDFLSRYGACRDAAV
jgi:carboxynorspermidine decarboxylase